MSTMTVQLEIPSTIYERLKFSAEKHQRSLKKEALICLESVLSPVKINSDERLSRARALRKTLQHQFLAAEINIAKEEGRA